MLFKPGGPGHLRQVISMCVNVVKIHRARSRHTSVIGTSNNNSQSDIQSSTPPVAFDSSNLGQPSLLRRRSAESQQLPGIRPPIGQRSSTYHHVSVSEWGTAVYPEDQSRASSSSVIHSAPTSPGLTVNVGSGAMLLKSSINTLLASQGPTILIVEDNELLRGLL